MIYNISKELFEAVMGFDDVSSYKIEMELIKWYGGCQLHINHFFFKCIDFMNDNDIEYYLSVSNDIRNDVFEFLDNWLKANKRQ